MRHEKPPGSVPPKPLFWFQKEKFRLRYRYRNWTLVSVPNTEIWFRLYTTSRTKLKKHSVSKNCSALSLFEQIVLIISKFLPSASNIKSFSQSLEHFFLTVGQNNFGNKIPFFFGQFLFHAKTFLSIWFLLPLHNRSVT